MSDRGHDHLQLTARVGALEEELGRLAAQLEVERRDREALAREVELLEEHRHHLCQICVASDLIRAAADRGALLEAVDEVITNLLGSEELAIVCADPGEAPRILHSRGVDPTLLPQAELAAALQGHRYVCSPGEAPTRPVACVPLRAGNRVVGALMVLSLLPHKRTLAASDPALLDVVGQQAGMGLAVLR